MKNHKKQPVIVGNSDYLSINQLRKSVARKSCNRCCDCLFKVLLWCLRGHAVIPKKKRLRGFAQLTQWVPLNEKLILERQKRSRVPRMLAGD